MLKIGAIVNLTMFLSLLLAGQAVAYKTDVHERMSEEAFLNPDSILTDVEYTRESIGFRYPLIETEFNQVFPREEGEVWPTYSIKDLIRYGAKEEDESETEKRSLNHFYDPINDAYLPFEINGVETHLNYTSPDWILEDNFSFILPIPCAWPSGQKFSYEDARKYYFDALTTEDYFTRQTLWGKTFKSLGHIVHHIQDMAQPQHVRLDEHLDQREVTACGFSKDVSERYNPSLYESFTFDLAFSKDENGKPVDRLKYDGYPVPDFVKIPRDLWKNGNQTGLAEFTNKNFFSAGTIGKYLRPWISFAPGYSEKIEIKTLCSMNPSYCNPEISSMKGFIQFFSTDITDYYQPTSAKNRWAVTYSIFDQDLILLTEAENPEDITPTYSLNRFNYILTQEFLVPRAVAYSTGLINYFFRGTMDISLPSDGIYGIADHASALQKDITGFKKIKLKIRNTTEFIDEFGNPQIEATSEEGELVAVAKFRRNECYEPNLSGELFASGQGNDDSCRSRFEDIVSSEPVSVPSGGIDNNEKEITFNFNNPIPINATDLFLQVVYRGKLGDEENAVMVATKDISEPTFIMFANHYDQLGHQPEWEYNCVYNAEPGCREYQARNWMISFKDPGSVDPLIPIDTFDAQVEINNIPAGSFSRIVVLADLENLTVPAEDGSEKRFPVFTMYSFDYRINYDVDEPFYDSSQNPLIYNATVFQANVDANPEVTEAVEYWHYRGVFINEDDSLRFSVGSWETVPFFDQATNPIPIEPEGVIRF